MRKIYMRAGMSPFDDFTPFDVIMKGAQGGNSGNMLFVYSMFRALLTEDTKIDVNYYNLDESTIDKVNEEYDAFVIPLANAFRPDFAEMTKLISFVKKMKIPCIVTGVGVQLPFEPDFSMSHEFDELAKEFCKAVLEKSASIGVRGEITAKYLEKLGFKNYIRVIGCPSMYAKGENLKISIPKNINFKSKVGFNAAKGCPENVWNFFEKSFRQFQEYYFIPQGIYDLKMLWVGIPSSRGKINYPCDCTHEMVQENRIRFFVNATSWIRFLEQMDLNIGIKIHGTVAAILAGVPSYLLAIDSRTRELAEYHNIPYMNAEMVNKSVTPYLSLIHISEPTRPY